MQFIEFVIRLLQNGFSLIDALSTGGGALRYGQMACDVVDRVSGAVDKHYAARPRAIGKGIGVVGAQHISAPFIAGMR